MFDDFQSDLPKPRPVVGWAGGKQRLLKHLLPLIKPHTAYVEVFGGGLAMFLAKQPSSLEVVNDINGDLVSFYRCCKYHLDALLDELDLVLNSRRDFEDYCAQPGLTEIQRAARWFIRNKLSFGEDGMKTLALLVLTASLFPLLSYQGERLTCVHVLATIRIQEACFGEEVGRPQSKQDRDPVCVDAVHLFQRILNELGESAHLCLHGWNVALFLRSLDAVPKGDHGVLNLQAQHIHRLCGAALPTPQKIGSRVDQNHHAFQLCSRRVLLGYHDFELIGQPDHDPASMLDLLAKINVSSLGEARPDRNERTCKHPEEVIHGDFLTACQLLLNAERSVA